ncbi:Probable aspartic proteinase GIP2 [Linum perenne]
MASSLPHSSIFLTLILSTLLIIISVNAQTSSRPKQLILPITKDRSTLQILTRFNFGTPLVTRTFLLDLTGKQLWLDCYTGYSNSSSTYRLARCGSAACSVADADCLSPCLLPPRPGCNNNTCVVLTRNPIRTTAGIAELALDTVSFLSTPTSGSRPSSFSPVSIPNFIFGCIDSFLDEFAPGVQGVFGLARDRVSLPSQLSTAFGGGSLRREFALCIPSSSDAEGVLFFGQSPYVFQGNDISSRFKYTRLVKNYERTASPNVQGAEIPAYFVKITSILVENSPIPINSSLLEFRRTGIGGSMIKTTHPYTILETTIYRSLVRAFEGSELIKRSNVRKVAAVAPLSDCYTKGNLARTRFGMEVPKISLVFENREVKWDILGENSMVDVSNEVMCLGFVDGANAPVDGGTDTTASIVIGALQMQDNLLQFDLQSSRMGFSNTMLVDGVRCSSFYI